MTLRFLNISVAFRKPFRFINCDSKSKRSFTSRFRIILFLNYQIFLSLISILIKNEEFNELKEILDELYMLPENFHNRHLLEKNI